MAGAPGKMAFGAEDTLSMRARFSSLAASWRRLFGLRLLRTSMGLV